jgi:biotin carboxylase
MTQGEHVTGKGRPIVALVDAYHTGRLLPPAFSRLGVDAVHVQSTRTPLTTMTPPDPTHYRANLVCGDRAAAAAELATYRPIAVVAGQEPGVRLADDLAARLGLTRNDAGLSAARRDKYEMVEALRRAGVRCAEHYRSDDPEAVVAWAERVADYPVVVKPVAGSGSVGVEICADAGQVREAAEAVLGSRTMYGETNGEVLVQSYLAGPEYAVDVVSCQGRRYLGGVWVTYKRRVGKHLVYDRKTLLNGDQSPVPELASYVDSALAALGIRFGPAHAEVIITPRGPTLVEVGARLSGSENPAFHDLTTGNNQADLTALAYCRPQEFLGDHAGRAYRRLREATVYYCATEADGMVRSIDHEVVAEIRALDTVYDVHLKYREGDRLHPTVDLTTSPMKVFLTGDSDDDIRRLSHLQDRVYRLD